MDTKRHMNVLLYSKFSQASRKFIEMMEMVPIFKENISLVCIDNKDVRERVVKSQNLKINEVPSILRIYQETGYVETFEGDKAFILLNTYIEEMKKLHVQSRPPPSSSPPQSQSQSPSPPQQQDVSQLRPPAKPQQMSMKQHLLSLNELEEVETPDQNIQISKQSSPQPFSSSVPSQAPSVNSNKSSFLTEIETENQQRGAPDRTIKSSGGGGGNIVLLAEKMKKEREQEPLIGGRPSF